MVPKSQSPYQEVVIYSRFLVTQPSGGDTIDSAKGELANIDVAEIEVGPSHWQTIRSSDASVDWPSHGGDKLKLSETKVLAEVPLKVHTFHSIWFCRNPGLALHSSHFNTTKSNLTYLSLQAPRVFNVSGVITYSLTLSTRRFAQV